MSAGTDRTTPSPPVAVGGVGGSGTRMVAELLRALGFHLGDDLNKASDNLWFTLLFKRVEILDCDESAFDQLTNALVSGLSRGRPLPPDLIAHLHALSREDRARYSAAWLQGRVESLVQAAGLPPLRGRWGWKEPNTHIVIERLWPRLPALRYIHVVRNGLDMAYSRNQNQLRLWGPHELGEDGPATPVRSLAYWCRVHRRMQRVLARNPERMYWLNYDALCRNPAAELARLGEFLGVAPLEAQAHLHVVQPPRPPRHVLEPEAGFSEPDIDFVRSLGYEVRVR